ncbi:MAG: HAD-IA family hydrolase [Chloroflexota bacterium]
MAFRALIFDFDGLILDTETPEVEVWTTIFAEHGHEYPIEHWSQIIGGWGSTDFDPAETLQNLTAVPLDLEALRKRHRLESDALIVRATVMDGVREVLAAAQRLELRCVIASSSERAWVEPHLRRLGMLAEFEKIITGDDVRKGRTKPYPDVFLRALAELQLGAREALVLEDSPNGITAAHAAGLRVVGVPNPVTAPLKMEADLVLISLAELPLEVMLKRLDDFPGGHGVALALPDAAS